MPARSFATSVMMTNKKGFNGNTCAILTALDKQSPDIAMGVDKSFELKNDEEDAYNLNGAGDQGMMFRLCLQRDPGADASAHQFGQ